MPLRTIYKDRGVKTADEIIAFIEEYLSIELMPYQKLFLKTFYKMNVKNGAEKPHVKI